MSPLKHIRHKVSRSLPAQFFVRRSKVTTLPGFRGIPIYDVVLFFIKQVQTVGLQERASSIAFNFVMAIPPSIIFLFTLIPFLPISTDFETQLYELIRDVVPGQKDNSVLISFLQDFINNPRNGLLSVGFILSIFFSSNAIMGVMRSFDKNYIGFKKRTGLQKRLTALQITFVLFVFVFATILLLVGQGQVLKVIGIKSQWVRSAILNLRWLFIVILLFASVSFIYRHAPAVHKKWRMINPGSILATFMMLSLTLVFSWWVSRFGNYNELYGSIGTVLILMLMIYFNSLVLLIGFELNVSISSLQKIAEERNNNLPDGDEKST
ncbi:MAG: YihY/virulence factor BrkB family protein [Chitinophagaceae bacterium]|nr:YihY/virulence factor BrkB family protein [Chitinophagaceae bacterium]